MTKQNILLCDWSANISLVLNNPVQGKNGKKKTLRVTTRKGRHGIVFNGRWIRR
jgi:hypothetical protein